MRSLSTISIITTTILIQSCNPPSNTNEAQNPLEYTEQAITYTQQSAEYRALCFQTYNLAAYRLQEKMRTYKSEKKPAVVLDIDETILDNSAYSVWCYKNKVGYSRETWKQWTDLAKADTIAGAGAFLKLADQLGVQIFYISNRRDSEFSSTIKNLTYFNFPQIDSTHFFLRTAEANKENRRQEVLKNHNILLLIGDNLNDLSEEFEEKLKEDRYTLTDQNQAKFGTDYIVLPNALYGSWEAAIYGYDVRLTDAQKDSVRNTLMRGH